MLAMTKPPAHELNWARGAAGEEMVAATLNKRLRHDARVLHDRRIPGSRANIDHIAVTRSGVWVIDAKRYAGAIKRKKPLFGAATLSIKGRDQTKLIAGLARQVEILTPVVAAVSPDVKVRGALCFVEGELPRRGALDFDGYALLNSRTLLRRLNARNRLPPRRSVRPRRRWLSVPTSVVLADRAALSRAAVAPGLSRTVLPDVRSQANLSMWWSPSSRRAPESTELVTRTSFTPLPTRSESSSSTKD